MVITQNTVVTYESASNDATVDPYVTTSQLISNTSPIDIRPISMHLLPLIKGTPIPGFPHTMQHDLLTQLKATADGYTIQSGYVDEDGYGTTIAEAYLDFLSSIRDRYYSMKKREPRLSTHELRILRNLRTLLEPS